MYLAKCGFSRRIKRPFEVILVGMTRSTNSKSPPFKAGNKAGPKRPAPHWLRQDAKAGFSELVRKVGEVVVIVAEKFVLRCERECDFSPGQLDRLV